MADDVSVAIGATTDTFTAPVQAASNALEALVTGPVKLLQDAFADLGKGAADAFGAIATVVDTAASEMEKLGKAAISSLVSAATGAGSFTATMAKLVGIVGGAGLAAAFTAVAGVISYANNEMLKLVTNAEQAGLSITRFQQLAYAAGQSGVGSDKFNDGVQKLAGLLDEASYKENDLSKLFKENSQSWKDTHGHVLDTSSALSVVANLVQHAASYSQAVKIAEWAGFAKEAVPFLRQGATAIQDMAKAAPLVTEAEARAAAETARVWNQTVQSWESWWKTAIIVVTGALQGLVNVAIGMAKIFGGTVGPAIYDIGKQITDKVDGPAKGMLGSIDAFGAKLKEVTKDTNTFTNEFQAAAAAAFKFGAGGGPFTKLIPEADKGSKDAMRAAREAAEEQIRLADMTFNGIKEKLEAEVKVHKITEDQKTSQLLTALDQRHASETAALGKEAAIGGLSVAQHQAIMDKMKTIDQKYANDRQKILDEALERDVKTWDTELGKIQSAFDSQLKGLLAGTTTWGKAMKSIFADLIMDIIKEFEKAAIAKLALGLASSIGGGGLGAGGIGGLLFGLLGKGIGALIPGMQEGAWNIPATQLALLHPGEMVMPAGAASQFRSNVQSGAAGPGTQVNMSLSAVDNTGMQAMINRIMPQIARSLSSYQSLNPSTQ